MKNRILSGKLQYTAWRTSCSCISVHYAALCESVPLAPEHFVWYIFLRKVAPLPRHGSNLETNHMIVKGTVKRIKDGGFSGDDGNRVEYAWVKLETEDGLTVEFGTKDASMFEEGEDVEVEVEKYERKGGKYGYKLVS